MITARWRSRAIARRVNTEAETCENEYEKKEEEEVVQEKVGDSDREAGRERVDGAVKSAKCPLPIPHRYKAKNICFSVISASSDRCSQNKLSSTVQSFSRNDSELSSRQFNR